MKLFFKMSSPASSAVKKVKNKVDNLVHNYPKLPDFPLGEENLPFQIGKDVSIKNYNTFLDHNESTGYKFNWENKDVYIVELTTSVHESVVTLIQDYFKVPNGGVFINPPINVLGKLLHYDPNDPNDNTNTLQVAADITIRPDVFHITNPIIPPCDTEQNPHGRIFCEIAINQSTDLWNTKCENWLFQQCVRYVFGIKIHEKQKGSNNRFMTARLWSRQMAASGVTPASIPAPRIPGVYIQEWDFGTVQLNGNNATNCIKSGLAAYQVTIPVSEVFWDTLLPSAAGYVATIPAGTKATITNNNFVIDLYTIQQEVIKNQL